MEQLANSIVGCNKPTTFIVKLEKPPNENMLLFNDKLMFNTLKKYFKHKQPIRNLSISNNEVQMEWIDTICEINVCQHSTLNAKFVSFEPHSYNTEYSCISIDGISHSNFEYKTIFIMQKIWLLL